MAQIINLCCALANLSDFVRNESYLTIELFCGLQFFALILYI
jgi:hypothetical protein